MELALAPAPTVWGRQALKDFYGRVASMPVDIVYIGETVCSKRDVLSVDDLIELARVLRQAQKRVVFSTLGLATSVEGFDEVGELLSYCDGIEVNSLGALNLLSDRSADQELVIGAPLNVYNSDSAEVFLSMGASRLVLPAELSSSSVAAIAAQTDGLEIPVWGNLACSISWRCYTARSLGLGRADCGRKCMDYPRGMVLQTVDGAELFIIDGPQVTTAKDYCLVEQLGDLDSAGVRTLRIHPCLDNTAEIVDVFRRAADGGLSLDEASSRLRRYSRFGLSNGWFHGKPGVDYISRGEPKSLSSELR